MAHSNDDEPNNKRVCTKDYSMSVCRACMTQMLTSVCGKQELYALKVPEGSSAEEVAGAVGGSIVTSYVRSQGVRIVVVRIAVGMLVSSEAVSVAGLPPAIVAIEFAGEAVAGMDVAKVTIPILAEKAGVDLVPLAETIGRTAPIIGDSILIKALSKSAAEFGVIQSAIDFVFQMRAEFNGENAIRAEERALQACCDAATAAMKKVWSDAPNDFHEASFKTETGVKRYYGKRRTRRL